MPVKYITFQNEQAKAAADGALAVGELWKMQASDKDRADLQDEKHTVVSLLNDFAEYIRANYREENKNNPNYMPQKTTDKFNFTQPTFMRIWAAYKALDVIHETLPDSKQDSPDVSRLYMAARVQLNILREHVTYVSKKLNPAKAFRL